MSLNRLDDEPLYETIVKAVRECIATGLLRPGDRLPTRPELANALNVSVGTIDRARQLLLRDHVLVQVPKRRGLVTVPLMEAESEQRLRGVIRELLGAPGGVIVRLALDNAQELTVRTTRSAVEWLELEPGRAATVLLTSSNVHLTQHNADEEVAIADRADRTTDGRELRAI